VVDVAGNAFRSAYRDPRFEPVAVEELPQLSYHISVLSPPEPLVVGSEAELLSALRPGVDGLILREGRAAATFLPAVWKSLPEPRAFVRELKQKAGLPRDHWSPAVRLFRYTAEDIE
jgi:AmmeMemoRadiSam system protein A